MDWITGEKFKALATFTFAPLSHHKDDYDGLLNTFHLSDLYNGCIIYTHTFYVKQLFEELRKTTKQVYVITHNSDMNVDETFEIPDNVLRWYAQNANITHTKLTHIPIGLENSRWFYKLHKKQKMLDIMRTSRDIKNWLYVNHNVNTNPDKRQELYDIARWWTYCTVESGKNGHDFDSYLWNLYHHKYITCPQGNGLDTHRTWEALYIGSIPIEIRNKNNEELSKTFPILLVNCWGDVTEDLLYKKWWELALKKAESWDALTFAYWQHKIKYGRE
jgi:hypothetical protein